MWQTTAPVGVEQFAVDPQQATAEELAALGATFPGLPRFADGLVADGGYMILNVSPTGGPSTVVTTFAGFAQAVGRIWRLQHQSRPAAHRMKVTVLLADKGTNNPQGGTLNLLNVGWTRTVLRPSPDGSGWVSNATAGFGRVL